MDLHWIAEATGLGREDAEAHWHRLQEERALSAQFRADPLEGAWVDFTTMEGDVHAND